MALHSYPEMSSAETYQWRELIQARTGLHFSDGRLYFMHQRLWNSVQAAGMPSYTAYYNDLVYGENKQQKWQSLVENLLNHESSFFRHQPSFVALTEHAIPDIVARKRTQNSPKIMAWSAGCSNGQETYSMAIALHDKLGALPYQLHVLGTDISQTSLQHARSGIYNQQLLETIPPRYQAAYVKSAESEQRPSFQIVDWLRSQVRFHSHNLHSTTSGYPTGQDIIFCQNVLIYFDKADQLAVVKQLANALNSGGYLFLGPADLTGLSLDALEPIRLPDALIYRKY